MGYICAKIYWILYIQILLNIPVIFFFVLRPHAVMLRGFLLALSLVITLYGA